MPAANTPSPLTLLGSLGQLPLSSKLRLFWGVAAILALVAGSWAWHQAPDYRVLYSNLSDHDAGSVLAALQQMNVPHQRMDGGAVQVPAEQVHALRLRLAAQGLPKGGAVAFDLQGGPESTTRPLSEQLPYQRALEAELVLAIQSLSAVQAARVQLAIPTRADLAREKQAPQASVRLVLNPGRTLDEAQVGSIAYLIARSVPDLAVRNVAILDQQGTSLTKLAGAAPRILSGLNHTQREYLARVEQTYTDRIESLLSTLMGASNVKAEVTADLNFTEREETAETYKPNGRPEAAAVRSRQASETPGEPVATARGVPGAASNQPGAAAQAAGSVEAPGAHQESTTNFEVDKSVQHVRNPVGTLRRLSVAVVLNNRKDTPLSVAELDRVRNLVKAAVGFQADRGDTVSVVNAAFIPDVAEVVPPAPVWQDPGNQAMAKELLRNLLIAALLLYLVFGVIRPLARDVAQTRHRPRAASSPEVPPVHQQGQPAVGDSAPSALSANLDAAKALARQNPQLVASVLQDWVAAGN